jgi:hypothetical protein
MRRLIALALVVALTLAFTAPTAEARHGHVVVDIGTAVGLALVAPLIIVGSILSPLVYQPPVYAYPPPVVERPVVLQQPAYAAPAYAPPPRAYAAPAYAPPPRAYAAPAYASATAGVCGAGLCSATAVVCITDPADASRISSDHVAVPAWTVRAPGRRRPHGISMGVDPECAAASAGPGRSASLAVAASRSTPTRRSSGRWSGGSAGAAAEGGRRT